MAKPDASRPPPIRASRRFCGSRASCVICRAPISAIVRMHSPPNPKELDLVGGKPLFTHEDIEERLKQLEDQPNFIVHDVRAALSDLPDMSMRFLDSMKTTSPDGAARRQEHEWERH